MYGFIIRIYHDVRSSECEKRRLHSHNKTNEMHQFLKFVFGIGLYMFRTGFLSIIWSLALYTQQ